MKKYSTLKPSGSDWLGKIPIQWSYSKIIYYTKLKTGGTPDKNKPEYWENGTINWMSSGEVNKKVIYEIDTKITELGFKNSNATLLPINSVMTALNGQGKTKGMVAILKVETTCNQSLASFICDEIKLHYRYLYYFLESKYKELRGLVGDGLREGLSLGLLKTLYIPLPSFSEQRNIADFLDCETEKIDGLISKKQKLIELLKEERAAIIDQAVTKGIDPNVEMKDSGIEWLHKIPTHWQVKRLKYIIKGKLKYGANESAELEDQSLPRYIRITDFGEYGELREDTFKSLSLDKVKDYYLEEGDILFARSGATVGKTFQFKNYKGLACFAGYLIKAAPLTSIILSDFLYYITRSNYYDNWKNSIFIQATIQNIGADKYSLFEVPIPPIEEQKKITSLIEQQDRKIDLSLTEIQKEIDLLQEYRTALISEVVTGKIDVGDEVVS